jgi:hypothetical protein
MKDKPTLMSEAHSLPLGDRLLLEILIDMRDTISEQASQIETLTDEVRGLRFYPNPDPESLTCYKCQEREVCEYVDDSYNTQGACKLFSGLNRG